MIYFKANVVFVCFTAIG